jgi:hypothetical protein
MNASSSAYDTGSESDSDGEPDTEKGVHLGDCGCVTADGEDCIADGTEDVSEYCSDSDDSGDEEEVSIEVDLSQEIYTDKSQEGVPYRKR